MKCIIWLCLLGFLTGCSTVSTTARPERYYQEPRNTEPPNISLFGDSTSGLDDAAIQNILSYRLALPSQNRVAVLDVLQNNYGRYYSSDFLALSKETVEGLVDNLKASPRIFDASYLPSFLIPEIKTLPHLRAAAARYQADVLLTYRSSCQSFQKNKIISDDVSRAYCTVEAVALDTRSGIVAFTAVSTNEFTTRENDRDVNFNETRRKAQLKATNIGLANVATQLRSFMEALPVL